ADFYFIEPALSLHALGNLVPAGGIVDNEMHHRVVGPFLLVVLLQEDARRAQLHQSQAVVTKPHLPTHPAVEIDRLIETSRRQEHALVGNRRHETAPASRRWPLRILLRR